MEIFFSILLWFRLFVFVEFFFVFGFVTFDIIFFISLNSTAVQHAYERVYYF